MFFIVGGRMAFATSQNIDQLLTRGLAFRLPNNAPISSLYTLYANGAGMTYWSNSMNPRDLSTLSTTIGEVGSTVIFQQTEIDDLYGQVSTLSTTIVSTSNALVNYFNSTITGLSTFSTFYNDLALLSNVVETGLSTLSTSISVGDSNVTTFLTSTLTSTVNSLVLSTSTGLYNYTNRVSSAVVFYPTFYSTTIALNSRMLSTSLGLNNKIDATNFALSTNISTVRWQTFSSIVNLNSTITGYGPRISNLERASTGVSTFTNVLVSTQIGASQSTQDAFLSARFQALSSYVSTIAIFATAQFGSLSSLSTTLYNSIVANNSTNDTQSAQISTLARNLSILTTSSILAGIYDTFVQLEVYTTNLINSTVNSMNYWQSTLYYSTIIQNTAISQAFFSTFTGTAYASTVSATTALTEAYISTYVSSYTGVLFSTSFTNITNTNSTTISQLYSTGYVYLLSTLDATSQLNSTNVKVGLNAGKSNQGTFGVAVGYNAGASNQGNSAVAIGYNAGVNNQISTSIVINASSDILEASTNFGFYVAPVRNDETIGGGFLHYNSTTKEIVYNSLGGSGGGSGEIMSTFTMPIYVSTLNTLGNLYVNTLSSGGNNDGNFATNPTSLSRIGVDSLAIACSSNGQYVIYADNNSLSLDGIYVSSDYGVSFTGLGYNYGFRSVAVSADGQIMLAASLNSLDTLYVSLDGGASFTPAGSGGFVDYLQVGVNSDGDKMVATATDGLNMYILTSPDSGTSWFQVYSLATILTPNGISISDDGQTIIFILANFVYKSTDGGNTFSSIFTSADVFQSLAVNNTATVILVTSLSNIFVSSDSGTSFNNTLIGGTGTGNIYSALNRNTGQFQIVNDYGTNDYFTSYDYGATWNTLTQGSIILGGALAVNYTGSIVYYIDYANDMFIASNGIGPVQIINMIGINTSTPIQTFDISGSLAFSSIVVENFRANLTSGAGRISIGNDAGVGSSGSAIALGNLAGCNAQSSHGIGIGYRAGFDTQGEYSIAIGQDSGNTTQGSNAIAIGQIAGYTNQGVGSISIGTEAGRQNQESNSIAIGPGAGYATQKSYSVALGFQAGSNLQGSNAVAIGAGAGLLSQGSNSVAIGYQAGQNNQTANSIVINASNTSLDATAAGLYVNPIRSSNAQTTYLYYDTASKEITYNSGILSVSSAIKVLGNDPGDMLSKEYGFDDRYGIGQYSNGITRIFAANAFTTASVRMGFVTNNDKSGGSTGFNDIMTVTRTSNVGINNSTPTFNLDVTGSMRATLSTVATTARFNVLNASTIGGFSPITFVDNIVILGSTITSNFYVSGNTTTTGATNASTINTSSITTRQINSDVPVFFSGGVRTTQSTIANVARFNVLNASTIGGFSPINFTDNINVNTVNISTLQGASDLKFNANMENYGWIARESARNWNDVASSSDGTKLVACVGGVFGVGNGQIYTSSDSGITWTARDSIRNWINVASSSDGSKLVAVVANGQIFTSTDSGANWTGREFIRDWHGVASSSDGVKLVAVVYGGQIYTSTDSGVIWTARESNRNWSAVASSSDGTKLVAVVENGQIYTSTDSGVNWTARDSNRGWYGVASSTDGIKLVAVVYDGRIYTSTDSGLTWTARENPRTWWTVSSSSDGTILIAGVGGAGGQLYVSNDSGVNWTPRESNRVWRGVACSADGTKLVGVSYGGQIYTSWQYTNVITMTNNGCVGINMSSPSYNLDVNGQARFGGGLQTSTATISSITTTSITYTANSIKLGETAGSLSQGTSAIAVGSGAGFNSQGIGAVAIGTSAGSVLQTNYSVAIGWFSGLSNQGNQGVAIGANAGGTSQGSNSVSIGWNSGNGNQGADAVAIGNRAGNSNQGIGCIAIGCNAGCNAQTIGAVAIGNLAGRTTQGENAVAIGSNAGANSQGSNAISIGRLAGNFNQGQYAIAIGHRAGDFNQNASSISINATTDALNPAASGFFVNPVRQNNNQTSNLLTYNTSTREIAYNYGLVNVSSAIIIDGANPGDMLSKRYGNADRFGVGQYSGGIVRFFGGYNSGSASARISFATNDDSTGTSTGFNDYLTVLRTGEVGVGTVSPNYNLDVIGTANFSTIRMVGGSMIRSLASGPSPSTVAVTWGDGSGWAYYFRGGPNNISSAMILMDNNRVGINKNSAPGYNLDVNGNALIGGTAAAQLTIKNNNISGNPAEIIFDAASGTVNAFGYETTRGFFWYRNGDKMNLLSNGNLGIGTNAPAATLDVNGLVNISTSIKVAGGNNPGDMLSKRYGDADRFGIGQYSGGIVRFFGGYNSAGASARISFATDDNSSGTSTGFNDYLTVLRTGEVGINCNAPAAKLDVNGTAHKLGNGTTWDTSSDERIKTNIEFADLSICLSSIQSLPLKRFKYDPILFPNDRDKTIVGFIAQDVKNVYPKAVYQTSSYGFTDLYSLDYDQIYRAHIGATQQLSKLVNAQQSTIESQQQLINLTLSTLTSISSRLT